MQKKTYIWTDIMKEEVAQRRVKMEDLKELTNGR